MLESLRNLTTAEIELAHGLPALDGEALVGYLLAKRGVAAARWRGNTCRLLVEYDADLFGSAAIVDFLHLCGVSVAAVRDLLSSSIASPRITDIAMPFRGSYSSGIAMDDPN